MASTSAPDSKETSAIENLLQTYAKALNSGSTSAAVSLYVDNAVLMPQHGETCVGNANIRDAYDAFFDAMIFDVTFDIKEIEVLAEDWAIARTASYGFTKSKTGGGMKSERNQELFVLKKDAGDWKIARYCFCTINPPPS